MNQIKSEADDYGARRCPPMVHQTNKSIRVQCSDSVLKRNLLPVFLSFQDFQSLRCLLSAPAVQLAPIHPKINKEQPISIALGRDEQSRCVSSEWPCPMN